MAYKRILDVSTFDTANVPINWGKVKADNISGVIIRAGFRLQEDENFKEHIEGAIKAGLHIGIYWFCYAWDKKMALAEAEKCLKIIQPYKNNIDMPVFYDIQGDSVTNAQRKGYKLDSNMINAMATVFCDKVAAQGYSVGLYFNKSWKNNIWKQSVLDKYYKWYAYYNDTLDYKDVDLWQFSSTQQIDGVYPVGEDVSYLINESIIKGTKKEEKTNSTTTYYTKQENINRFVAKAKSYYGITKNSSGHQHIIDVFNKSGLGNITMSTAYAWCATYVSAVAIQCGLTDIIPVSASCNQQINKFKQLNEWIEDESVTPEVGYICYYDWDDSGYGNNTGEADHVGIVIEVKSNSFVVIEGNKHDKCDTRTMSINGRYIRGFGAPAFGKVKIAKTTTEEKKPTQTTPTTSNKYLTIDGSWGKQTTMRAQKVFNTTQDGIISRQPASNKKYLPNVSTSSWEFFSNANAYRGGSQLIKAIQIMLKNRGYYTDAIDGWCGKNCVTALQKYLISSKLYKGTADGSMGPLTVKAFQEYLNRFTV